MVWIGGLGVIVIPFTASGGNLGHNCVGSGAPMRGSFEVSLLVPPPMNCLCRLVLGLDALIHSIMGGTNMELVYHNVIAATHMVLVGYHVVTVLDFHHCP